MSKKYFTISILFLSIYIFAAACGGAAPSNDTAQSEVATEIPTEEPTIEPQPTATEVRAESGYLTLGNDGFIPVYQDELTPFFLPEDMLGGDMENFQLIQNGYFVSYDPEALILTMNSRIMTGNMYRQLDFQLDQDQKVVCLPETVGDTPIGDINYMITNGEVSFPPGPGERSFDEILVDLTDTSYFVIVLAETVQADQLNLATTVAGICP